MIALNKCQLIQTTINSALIIDLYMDGLQAF